MAFTNDEKQALIELKSEGYSFSQALGFIASTRLGNTSRVERDLTTQAPEPSDAVSDLGRGVQGVGQAFSELKDRSQAADARSPVGAISGKLAAGLRFLGDSANSLIGGAVRALPGGTETLDAVEGTVGIGVNKVMQTGIAQKTQQAYENLPEGVKQPIRDVGNIAQGTFDVLSLGTVPIGLKSITKSLERGIAEFASTGIKEAGEAGIKSSLNLGLAPENIMQRVARISKGKQAAFEERAGESVGEYLVNRGMFGDPEAITEQLYARMQLSKSRVDSGLSKIQGTYKNGTVKDALDQLAEREARVSSPNTPSRDQARVSELKAKHDSKGLTLSEVNEVKRLYERNVKVDYLNERVSDKIAMATNVDSNLREFVVKEAAKSGFKNVEQLNMETTLAKQLLDDLGAEYAGQQGNNLISLSDAFFLAEAASNPTALAAFGLKNVLSSKSAMSAVARLINGKRARVGLPEADIEGILQLPSPAKDAPNVSSNVPVNLPESTQSTLDAAERVNPNIKQPEASTPQASPQQLLNNANEEASSQVRAEMLDIAEAGIKNTPDGGVARYTSFPQWIPSELRSKDLFKRVWKHIDEGTEPKPSATKEIDLLARVKQEILAKTAQQDGMISTGSVDDIPFSIALTVGAATAAYYLGDDGNGMPLVVGASLFRMSRGERVKLINKQISSLDKAIAKNRQAGASWSNTAVKDLTEARKKLVKERESI